MSKPSPTTTVITPNRIRFGMRMNMLAGSLGSFWLIIAMGMPFTMLLEALGARGVTMGAAQAVIQLSMLLQLPGAIFAEFLNRRKVVWAMALLTMRLLWFVPAVAMLVKAPAETIVTLAILTTAVSFSLNAFVSASWWSWMALSITAMKGCPAMPLGKKS